MVSLIQEHCMTPHPSISYTPYHATHLKALRTLNSGLFPVKYNDAFYNVLERYPLFTWLAFDGQVLVGAICCRLEAFDDAKHNGAKLYIMTIGVRPTYRRLGIGKQLIQRVFQQADKHPDIIISELNVQTSNTQALAFYKSFGYAVVETIHNYYARLDPPDCFRLVKWLRYGK